MIKNLRNLMQTVKPGDYFEIAAHCRSELVGQIQEVAYVNSKGMFSILSGGPEYTLSGGHGGLGCVVWWNKASFWEFVDGVCTQYASDTVHNNQTLVISFRILPKEVGKAGPCRDPSSNQGKRLCQ